MWYCVAPYTGAWIETTRLADVGQAIKSLPTRGRGLKQFERDIVAIAPEVAPYTGAWIETFPTYGKMAKADGRSLHGGVD